MTIRLSRGDVVLTRFPFTDLAGSAVRPALVVSAGQIGQDVVLAGISSVLRAGTEATDLIVQTAHPEFKLTGLRVASAIRLHKLAAVESAVIQRRLGQLGPALQAEVDRLLRRVLGL
jgi:mRNA interferase MazF